MLVTNPRHLQAGAVVAAGIGLAVALVQSGNAAGLEDFFRGKTVSVVIGYSVGGGYDSYARLLSHYMGEHIAGRPTLVAQNMPGAGSVKAANYIYGVATKDGTVFGTFGRTVPVAPLLGTSGATFDATKFTWLGSISRDTSLCITSAKSPIKTWDDFLSKRSTLGGEGAGSDPDVFALLFKNLFGAKIKLVSGYPGTNDTSLALERGEIDGFCGLSWSTLKSHHQDWLDAKSINIIVQAGLKKEPELGDVPSALDLAKTREQQQILKLILSSQEMARPFAAPPGLPADRKAALVTAFADTMKDRAFLAEAGKETLDVNPVSARDVEALMTEVYATPKEVTDKAAKLTAAQ